MATESEKNKTHAFHFNHLLSKQSVSPYNRGAREVLEMHLLFSKDFPLTNMTNRVEQLSYEVLTSGLMMGTRLHLPQKNIGRKSGPQCHLRYCVCH